MLVAAISSSPFWHIGLATPARGDPLDLLDLLAGGAPLAERHTAAGFP
jgi:hypothetical protein